MNKSKFLTFFFSFVPGLGHFYLGQMNRGLQLMIAFFGSIFLFDFIGINGFPFILPIIWFYGLFDALQQHRIISETQTVVDQPLLSWDKLQINKQWFGWGFIILGIYLIIDKMSYNLFGWQYSQLVRNIMIAVIFIVFGIYLISGKVIFFKNNRKEG